MAKEWSTQTDLGRTFGLSARQIGSHLAELGLRSGTQPTMRATREQLSRKAKLRDGTEFYLWHTRDVTALLIEAGFTPSPDAPTSAGRGPSSPLPRVM